MIFDAQAAADYDATPYLRNAADQALETRHKAICGNLWQPDIGGNAVLRTDPMELRYWVRQLTGVRTEMHRRGLAAEVVFDEATLLPNHALPAPVIKATENLALPRKEFIVRFSKAEYVRDALEQGKFKINPAVIYKHDSSLNAAQADDELSHFAVTANRQLKMELVGFLPGEDASQARPMPHKPLEMFHFMNTSNFYVLCMSGRFNARMFVDFKADAALVIKNPDEFSRRLGKAIAVHVPGGIRKEGHVSYYDPYAIQRENLKAGFSKNFAYAYQDEYRMLWWPEDKAAPLSPIFVEAGDLSDIAHAVFL